MSNERNYWQRMSRRQMSRRALLGASARAGVGATGLALVGCGDDDDDGAQTVAQQQAQQQQSRQAAQQAQQQQQAQPQAQQQAQEQSADQQAQQADQQEQTVAEAQDQQQQQQTAAEASAITRGGTLRFSTPAATHDYFDPHRGVFGPTQFWMGLYMNYLIRWQNKEKGIMQSDIASLPEIPDNTTYIFTVDQGAAYWDRFPTEGGRMVTAEDIRFNAQRQIDSVDADGIEDTSFLTASKYQQTDTVSVLDEQTIRFTTSEPDSTYLGAHLSPFSWITSPEAIEEFGNRWRDEQTNVELSSGTGAYIPLDYDPDLGINLDANPNYWKTGVDGGPLPYLDRIEFTNLLDATAVDAAYRGKGIDIGGFPLSSLQVEGILNDFPDHQSFDVPFGFTIQIRYNFNPDWDGEDGLGNPWADRRLAYAFHVATDRYLLIDAVYLGSAKISAIAQAPWFNQAWTVPPDELATWPGYRPNRDEDIKMARDLLSAAGVEPGSRTFYWITPDVWEQTYPGITETVRTMYEQALDVELSMDIQPYTVILQRLLEGTHPGQTPAWTNPPQDLDPTGEWNITHVVGGSSNFSQYNYPPAEEMILGMKRELDVEKRKETATELLQIFLGVHPDHGVDGFTGQPSVMNAISPQVEWPYVNNSEDVYQFAHASHRYDDTWLDTTHPEFPA